MSLPRLPLDPPPAALTYWDALAEMIAYLVIAAVTFEGAAALVTAARGLLW